ncbi:MAG: tetratricopeptide repeat protein [Bryobacteraceae bacterium]
MERYGRSASPEVLTGVLAVLAIGAAFPRAGYALDDFVGARVCGGCHPAQYQSQRATHHARALQPILDSPISANLARQPVAERNGWHFAYERAASGLRVTAGSGGEKASTVLEWAFGAGAQGITPVGRLNGQYFEHRISWYTSVGHPALTAGHASAPDAGASAALGMPQSPNTIYRCFNCHATGVRPGPDLSSFRPGVECERCHGPGREHAAKPSSGSILSDSRATASQIVQFCGECHRLPQSSRKEPEIVQPESVRFAPVGLVASRCYQASGTLSCITCHNPHADARKEDAFYVAKCLECHAAAAAPVSATCRRAAKEDCLPCHMPRSRAIPLLEFTDHRIRILKTAAGIDAEWQPVDRALGAGDFALARQLLDEIRSTGSRWHLTSSKIFDGLNDPARAVEEAQTALDWNSRDEAAWLQLGQIFLAHNTPRPAFEIFSDAEKIFPDSLLVHLGKGLALKDLQRYDGAEEQFRFCLQKNPGFGLAFDALAAVYLQVSDFENLTAVSQQFLKANPSDYRGYYYLAAAKEGSKQEGGEAENLLRASLLLNPNFAASHALLGKILLAGGRAAEAAAALEEATRLRPDYAPAHLYLANAYRKLGRSADAKKEFDAVRLMKEKERTPAPALSYHRGARR